MGSLCDFPGFRGANTPCWTRLEGAVAGIDRGATFPRWRPDSCGCASSRRRCFHTLSFQLGVEEVPNALKGDDASADPIQRQPSTYTITMPFSVELDQPLDDSKHFLLFMASCPVGGRKRARLVGARGTTTLIQRRTKSSWSSSG